MNTHRFRSLIWLVGCLGCAALAAEASDLPSRALLDSYPYQPALVALPTPRVAPATVNPVVAPSFVELVPDYRESEALEAAFAEQRRQKDDALFIWNLDWNEQLQAICKPTFREMVIPWSPMTTTSDLTFSPSDINGATSKVQVRVPLLSLAW